MQHETPHHQQKAKQHRGFPLTEQHRSDGSLSFGLLNFVFDNLPVGLFCKDYSNDGRFTIWNNKCEELFGYKKSDLLGKKSSDFLNKDLADHFLKLDLQCIAAKRAVVTEEHFSWPERGVDNFYRVIRLPIFKGKGAPHLVIGIAEDKTKEKVSEDRLIANQEFQDLLLRVAPVGICRFMQHGALAYTNDKLDALFEQKWPKGTHVDWQACVHADDWPDFEKKWQLLFNDQTPFEQIFRLSQANGEVIWLKATIIPLHRQDKKDLEYVGAFVDITEVKHLQRLIQEQQVQIINASKMSALGEMAGGIAHEINNPLAIIRGAAELLEHGLQSGKLDQQQLSGITVKIRKTVDRVAKIIRGLRTFSRDADEDPLEECFISDILSETLDFCRSRLLSLQIKLLVGEIDPYLRVTCRAVPLSQVFLNLLNNATDAVANDPSPWIRIDVSDKGSYVEICFTDSGEGLPQKIAEKIMNPFFTTKAPGTGSGLGLSISKRIVEGHSGRIYLDESSHHTRFIVELPKNITQNFAEDNERLL